MINLIGIYKRQISAFSLSRRSTAIFTYGGYLIVLFCYVLQYIWEELFVQSVHFFPKECKTKLMTVGGTWVVQQHNQIKCRVSILSSKVDISPLAQQVLDNVFITGRRREGEKTKEKSRRELMIMSAFIRTYSITKFII